MVYMNQEKFSKKMELHVLGYRNSGARGSSLYKYITAATVQGHDPSTASHPGHYFYSMGPNTAAGQ